MMENSMEHIAQEQKWTRRRMGVVAVAGAAAVFLSGCIGGGGGDSSDSDWDLRAAYDRIVEGMTIADVERTVGVQATTVSKTSRYWENNKEALYVDFWDVNDVWLVGSVRWKGPVGSGGVDSLTKEF